MPRSKTFNMDCMELMRCMPDKNFDLAIVDPPYGLQQAGACGKCGAGKLKNRAFHYGTFEHWDTPPNEEYFKELFRVSKNQIVWGGNYFSLPPCRCFIAWDKVQPWENFSQVEFAWTSFKVPAKLFRYDNRISGKIHPTQKPIALYAWLLDTFAKEGDKILDTHLGSGSSRIAAFAKGLDFIGCEINKKYYDLQEERFARECLNIINENGKQITQQSLFTL